MEGVAISQCGGKTIADSLRDPKPAQPVVDRQPPPVPLEEAGAGSVARR